MKQPQLILSSCLFVLGSGNTKLSYQGHVASILGTIYFPHCTATLTSNPNVACPDNTVTFTCTLPGDRVRWEVTPPPGSGLSSIAATVINNTVPTFTFGNPGFTFHAVLTNISGGMAISTLTTVTNVSLLEGSMVMCNVLGGVMEGPLLITIAGMLDC